MRKIHFIISVLVLLISLSSCKSSVKESDTVVSPDGNVLCEITAPEDTLSHNWVYDVNDGAYRMEHTTGAGSGQIVITDRKGRLCAAYGYNQCQPQIAKVCYDDNSPQKLILMWLSEDEDVDWDDVGVLFDYLLNSEVKVEKFDSVEICSLIYDSTGHIIEVSDSLSGKSLKAPDGYYIASEIVETGALEGVLDYSFRIKNMILPREKTEPYVEKEYHGYELCREIKHISPMMVLDAFSEIHGEKDTLKYTKAVKDNLTIYTKAFRDGNKEVSVWQNGYLLKNECISKWNTVIWRKDYALSTDKKSYTVKSYKYDYAKKVLVEEGSSTIKVSETKEMYLKDITLN